MNCVGIDPGLSGALALLDPEGQLIDLRNMPTLKVTKSRRTLDTMALVGLLEDWRAFHGEYRAVIERAGVMPGQGGSSGFKNGVGFGTLLGILAARKTPHEIITPQKWQKAIFGQIEKGTSKDWARKIASERWPKADLGKRKSEDRSDALCIAEYGRRVWGGR